MAWRVFWAEVRGDPVMRRNFRRLVVPLVGVVVATVVTLIFVVILMACDW